MFPTQPARCILAAEEIADDLRSRKGFRDLWDTLDDDIREDIVAHWGDIIALHYAGN